MAREPSWRKAAQLQRRDPAGPAETLAHLINAYNGIVRALPPRKPGWWGFVSFFMLTRHDVDGERLTLQRLERRIQAHGDPRIHFAINCGASSCPPIREYLAERLDAQLDLATRAYLASPTGYRLDEGARTLHVSRLFRWYRREFGDPLAFIRRHVDDEARQALDRLGPSPRVAYLPWDWTPGVTG